MLRAKRSIIDRERLTDTQESIRTRLHALGPSGPFEMPNVLRRVRSAVRVLLLSRHILPSAPTAGES
jgi:hypothetical protein